jgi:hypothetical protein
MRTSAIPAGVSLSPCTASRTRNALCAWCVRQSNCFRVKMGIPFVETPHWHDPPRMPGPHALLDGRRSGDDAIRVSALQGTGNPLVPSATRTTPTITSRQRMRFSGRPTTRWPGWNTASRPVGRAGPFFRIDPHHENLRDVPAFKRLVADQFATAQGCNTWLRARRRPPPSRHHRVGHYLHITAPTIKPTTPPDSTEAPTTLVP